MLTVGGMVETARYPHTARMVQFGGRFDSEGVELARIHIPQLSLSTLWFASACRVLASDGHWKGRCLPDGFALGEGVSVCGLGGVEGKFLKAMVEKHPLLWARAPGATPNRGQLQRQPWNHPSKHRCTTRVPQTAVRRAAISA
ncbi:hypothetical protein SVAN01_08083 [Stagonosporopsis vannaccii]|nr:hypothetical protein SVAN01_08083 [Stagonosporopsis vannaccii]